MGGLALGGFTGPSSRTSRTSRTSRLAFRGRSRPTAEFTGRFSFRGVTCCGHDWWKASASPWHAFQGPARTGGSEALGVPTAGAGAMASASGSRRSSGLGNLELQGEASMDFSFSGSFPGTKHQDPWQLQITAACSDEDQSAWHRPSSLGARCKDVLSCYHRMDCSCNSQQSPSSPVASIPPQISMASPTIQAPCPQRRAGAPPVSVGRFQPPACVCCALR